MNTPLLTILHVDMDAFYAAIEALDHPEWRGLPLVVGSPPDQRGVVATCSYEARRFGIHSAMPSRTAGKLCPHAIFVPPRMDRYAEISSQIMAIRTNISCDLSGWWVSGYPIWWPRIRPSRPSRSFLTIWPARRRIAGTRSWIRLWMPCANPLAVTRSSEENTLKKGDRVSF